MPHWLIAYDRKRGELTRCEEYADSAEALAERFRLEREAAPDAEIVVLGADSLEMLKVTHGRYFFSMGELARRRAGMQAEGLTAADLDDDVR
jgi:hypothetical protein